MGKLYEVITPAVQKWLEAQAVFFVATAPLAASGHVNCSPKGADTFRVAALNGRAGMSRVPLLRSKRDWRPNKGTSLAADAKMRSLRGCRTALT
jgi:hypothetical protein